MEKNSTEQTYLDSLERQACVSIGLLAANNTTDGWTRKMYRERMDKINAECVQLHDVVNNRHRGDGHE